jgi:hypothetical protein
MLRSERRLGAIGCSVKSFLPDAGYVPRARGSVLPYRPDDIPILRLFRRLPARDSFAWYKGLKRRGLACATHGRENSCAQIRASLPP